MIGRALAIWLTAATTFGVALAWPARAQVAGAAPFSPASQADGPSLPDSLFDAGQESRADAEITVYIRVPHNDKAVDAFSVYPYPVKPPPVTRPVAMLPDKPNEIKARLLTCGYTNRVKGHQAFPTFGWRWQYAFEAALRRAGGNLPHTILGMYKWRNEMVEHVLPEIMRLNQAEKDRKARYAKAVQEHQASYVELENEATRKGLYPVMMPVKPSFTGQVKVPAGTWWIAGSHKVPGLLYYWQLPVTVAAGEKAAVSLTEGNALLIQGGW